MSQITDRLRSIVGPACPAAPARPAPPALETVLGGEWRVSGGKSCFVVERRREPAAAYGHETVGTMAARLECASAEAPLVAAAPARAPFLFFDLETTGLSGGAGTYAFLIGCGWFDEGGGFVTRQFMLTRPADERALLAALANELARAGALVTFNGKSFDAPLIETRYLFHRLEWIGGRLPHLDVLRHARQFWGKTGLRGSVPDTPERNRASASATGVGPRGSGISDEDCSLLALERRVLGAHRVGDVPGFEIPARYFDFLRSGEARPLAAVLEHNRLDLLSLAGMTARLLDLVRMGPSGTRDGCEALALGRVYWRAGQASRAIDAYRHASGARSPIRTAALRSLALTLRRERRHDEAAAAWRQVLAVPDCPRQIAWEANEALAIHHEHRARDLALARTFALGCVDDTRTEPNESVRHRLARIERKMNA